MEKIKIENIHHETRLLLLQNMEVLKTSTLMQYTWDDPKDPLAIAITDELDARRAEAAAGYSR